MAATTDFEFINARRAIAKQTEARAERELNGAREELAALDVIERNVRAQMTQEPSLNLPGVEPPPPPDAIPIPFARAVRETVQEIKLTQFAVSDVEEALRKKNMPLPIKSVRTRITLELLHLVAKGTIKLVHKGVGNAPNRYRLVAQSENGEGAGRVNVQAPSFTNLQH